MIAFAQNVGITAYPAATTPLGVVLFKALNILDIVMLIVGALALLWFFWGIIQYVLKGENIEKREQSRDFMIYSVIAFFVMFSIWGLVHMIQNTFFVGVNLGKGGLQLDASEIPKVPLLK